MNETAVYKSSLNMSLTKGILFLLLGLAAMIWPAFTVAFVVISVALFAIISGLMTFIAGLFSIGKGWSWLWGILLGIIAIILGIMVFVYPVISAVTYIWLFGAYLVISGFVLLVRDPARSGAADESRGVEITDGILSIIFGILIVFFPVSTTVVLYWVYAIYAVIAGIILICTSISRKRKLKKALERSHAHAT